MKRWLWITVLGLGGCAARERGTILVAPPPDAPPVANLVLGSGPDVVRLGRALSYRSSWPSVAHGFVFDDVSYYADFQLDEQYFQNRFDAFYRSAESVRTGVLVR
jgi:hypothetical protein